MAKISLPLTADISSFTASIWFQLDQLVEVTTATTVFRVENNRASFYSFYLWQSAEDNDKRLFLIGNIDRTGPALPGGPYIGESNFVNSQINASTPDIFPVTGNSSAWRTGTWYHAAVTYDGTGSKSYSFDVANNIWSLPVQSRFWKCVLNGSSVLSNVAYSGPTGVLSPPRTTSDQTATTTADTTAGDSNALHFGARPAWYEAILAKGYAVVFASMSGNTIQPGTMPIVAWESNGDLHVTPGGLSPLTPSGTVVTFHDVQDPQVSWTETQDWAIAQNGDSFVLGAIDSKIRFGDVFVYFNRALDVTDESVFNKFVRISGGVGTPQRPSVAINAFGAPDVLLRGDHSSFPNNLGGGGSFTVTGTISDFTPSPSY